MNGKVKSVIENHKPETYKNVKVFAAGKYVPPSNAWIRNLQVSTSANNMAMTTLPSLTADIQMVTFPPYTADIEVVTLPKVTAEIEVITLPTSTAMIHLITSKGNIEIFALKVQMLYTVE